MERHSALITGITGQDGSYLAEYLLEEGYDVYGLVRRTSSSTGWRIAHLRDHPRLTLLEGDLLDYSSLATAIETADPDEVYNLAAQSHVGTSFSQPMQTSQVTGLGALRLLEAIRTYDPTIRFYQASTSELFGNVGGRQDESAAFRPTSPYAVAKLQAHWATRTYREAYDIPGVCGVLFNHESPRRGEDFVTRKITLGAARIAAGEQDELRLGNLDAKRDWGHARDYVRAMHAMTHTETPHTEYVLGTGETHTVRECARVAFDEVGLDYHEYVVVDEEFYRPADVDVLHADPTRAREELGWTPTYSFDELIREMVRTDAERVRVGETAVVTAAADAQGEQVMVDGGGN